MTYCVGRGIKLYALATRQLERPGSWQGQLQTSAEDAFIYTVLNEALSVLDMFQDDTLYKLTYLLTHWLSYLL